MALPLAFKAVSLSFYKCGRRGKPGLQSSAFPAAEALKKGGDSGTRDEKRDPVSWVVCVGCVCPGSFVDRKRSGGDAGMNAETPRMHL